MNTASKSEKTEKDRNRISFYSFDKLIFCWPILFLGYLFKVMDCFHIGNTEVMAWIYIVAFLLVMGAMGVDLNRNVTAFFIAVGIALTAIIMYLGAKGVIIFHHLYIWLKDLNPTYPAQMGFMISMGLTVLVGIMLFKVRINNHWVFTNNEFEHTVTGLGDDSLARGAKRVRAYYPDFFEWILGGFGDLIICDAARGEELRRIHHVFGLTWKWRKIDRILSATSVTTKAAELEETGG